MAARIDWDERLRIMQSRTTNGESELYDALEIAEHFRERVRSLRALLESAEQRYDDACREQVKIAYHLGNRTGE